jgi:hypothetical protein
MNYTTCLLKLRKQDLEGAKKWLVLIKKPESAFEKNSKDTLIIYTESC